MERPKGQSLENEQVKSALYEIELFGHHGCRTRSFLGLPRLMQVFRDCQGNRSGSALLTNSTILPVPRGVPGGR
jgi:hypothetical protein